MTNLSHTPEGVIYFLDDKKYPHAEVALSYLISKDLGIVIFDYDKKKDKLIELLGSSSNDSFYTIRPEVYTEIKAKLPNSRSFINAANESILKEVKSSLMESKSSFIDKMKLTPEDIDPITLSNIFQDSPIKSVKLQTNGTPVIIQYEGMNSFNYINSLTAGIITPATQSELNCTESDPSLPNQDYIYQNLPGMKGSVFLCITEWINNDMKWYEIQEIAPPKELTPLLSTLDRTTAYFLYLKKLNTYKISAIFSGINYHVNPSYYL